MATYVGEWRASDDTAFLGHPRGLGWLSFTELWERFSYYGMQALLVLYMTHRLLLPGHAEHVLGFRPFRRVIESVYGPLSAQALASAIFGLYAGFVYQAGAGVVVGGEAGDALAAALLFLNADGGDFAARRKPGVVMRAVERSNTHVALQCASMRSG